MQVDRVDSLFVEHQPDLYRFARRLCGSHDEARDLVQETFVRLLQARVSLDDDHARGWLYRTLVNISRDRRRRSVVRSRFRRAEGRPAASSAEPPLVARLSVEQALGRLDARRRAVVVLHEIDGEPVAEIARLMGIAPVTVRWHLARARSLLSRLLASEAE